ncbi:MAG TPA: SsrA-binding protein SmpB [bacterium]|nr:SsrA-binding protein SmpB [bacterium]HPN30921.1 SsrA-binding protein SmpB [bacterium]
MKNIYKNKKAYFEYEILEKFEAGIVLKGSEVKSIREGKINFIDSYCEISDSEIYCKGLHISQYKDASYNNDDPLRNRKLLLNKKEINKIAARIKERGLSCVPLSVYFNKRNFVKMEIGLGRGKRLYDKREKIKKNDVRMENSAASKIKNIKL